MVSSTSEEQVHLGEMNTSAMGNGLENLGPRSEPPLSQARDASKDHRRLACRLACRGLQPGRSKVRMLFLTLVALEAGTGYLTLGGAGTKEALCQLCSQRGPATMHT